jgi:hypothetical protein
MLCREDERDRGRKINMGPQLEDDLKRLIKMIPKGQWNEVMFQENCELDHAFLGFIDIDEALAKIIPRHFDVIDLGSYCAAQCFYFQDHKSYVGVDVYDGTRFQGVNTHHYTKPIEKFIEEDLNTFDLEETFAICSYVPGESARHLVRTTFSNVFVFYPSDKKK